MLIFLRGKFPAQTLQNKKKICPFADFTRRLQLLWFLRDDQRFFIYLSLMNGTMIIDTQDKTL